MEKICAWCLVISNVWFLFINLTRHGEKRKEKYNFPNAVIAGVIVYFLYKQVGIFNHL